jgi:hypothetical protein
MPETALRIEEEDNWLVVALKTEEIERRKER